MDIIYNNAFNKTYIESVFEDVDPCLIVEKGVRIFHNRKEYEAENLKKSFIKNIFKIIKIKLFNRKLKDIYNGNYYIDNFYVNTDHDLGKSFQFLISIIYKNKNLRFKMDVNSENLLDEKIINDAENGIVTCSYSGINYDQCDVDICYFKDII